MAIREDAKPTRLRPALFLDRDGVINEETGYLHKWEDVRFVPGAAEMIHTANTLGLPVIVITNQTGIGRGYYTDTQFHELMLAMREALAEKDARIDAIYYSPYHPLHGLGDYRRETECRKPRPGMLLQAAEEHGLNLCDSVLVGDRCTDLQAGAAAGLRHLFLIAGTEEGVCPGVAHTPVTALAEVNRWLREGFTLSLTQSDATAPCR